MSPRLQRQIAEAEAAEARDQAKAERQRAERAETLRESANQAAIAQALQEGEEFHSRMLRGQGVGHQPAEFIALASARQGVEDERAAALEMAAFRQWQAAQSASNSGDVSAPSQRQLEADRLMRERAARYRDKEYERTLIARGLRAGAY
jgi:hypothetical protein